MDELARLLVVAGAAALFGFLGGRYRRASNVASTDTTSESVDSESVDLPAPVPLSSEYHRYYFDEFTERERLRSAVATPVTLLTLAGTLLGYLGQHFAFVGDPTSWIFGGFFLCASMALVRATYYLARSYHGHTYKLVPSVTELRHYWRELYLWHKTVDSTALATADFLGTVDQQYSTAISVNAVVNRRRSAFLYRGVESAIGAIVFTGLCLGPFLFNSQRPSPPQTAASIILNAGCLNMPDQDKKPTPAPPPSPPPKPQPPPLKDLREGQIPSVPRKP
jgi:hypothetical protein